MVTHLTLDQAFLVRIQAGQLILQSKISRAIEQIENRAIEKCSIAVYCSIALLLKGEYLWPFFSINSRYIKRQ